MVRADEAAGGAGGAPAVCESCGGDDDDLQPVWPTAATGESAELWCPACRAAFAHEPATDGDDEGGDADESG